MGERPHEICAACGDATGHAGYGEDSIGYVDGMIGPLCEECNERLRLEIVVDEPIELALREQVREVELENMALAEQLAACRALLREACETLRKIAWPIDALREDAAREGKQIDGMMACLLAADGNYLRGIAEKAYQRARAAGGVE